MSDIIKLDSLQDDRGKCIIISTITTQVKFTHFESVEESLKELDRVWTAYRYKQEANNKKVNLDNDQGEILDTVDMGATDFSGKSLSFSKTLSEKQEDTYHYPEGEALCHCGLDHNEVDILNQVLPMPVDKLNEVLYGDPSLFINAFFKKRNHLSKNINYLGLSGTNIHIYSKMPSLHHGRFKMGMSNVSYLTISP